MKVTIVDSEPAIRALIDDLENLPTQPPSLYLDLEGVKLSRHGSISIIQLFVLPKDHVFLVDVFLLKGAALCTSNRSGTNLRSIFESALVPKVFFDVRNDCDALFSHFQVSMSGVHDVQLLEVATRSNSRDRVSGLGKCIEKDAQLTSKASAVWKATKKKGQSRFAPEHGGSYEVFNSRPMPQDIIDYCTQDVVYLPVLWKVYTQKISPKWMREVQDKTNERLLASQEPSYEPHGRDKTLSPWANPAKTGRGYRSGNTGAKVPERKTMTAVAELAATEAVRKTTVALLNAKPESQPPVGQEGLRRSTRLAALEATKKITEITADRAKLDLPMRNKDELEGRSHNEADPILYPATPKWNCNTCSREMQETQKEEHLAGKQHMARTKRTTAPQTGPAKQMTLPPTTTTTTFPQTGRPSTKAKSRQTSRRETAEARGTTRGGKRQAATAPLHSPEQRGLPYPPDHLFIGFQGSGSGRGDACWGGGPSFSRIALGYDEDYSVCDKDCGWCGHCMDGVDI